MKGQFLEMKNEFRFKIELERGEQTELERRCVLCVKLAKESNWIGLDNDFKFAELRFLMIREIA